MKRNQRQCESLYWPKTILILFMCLLIVSSIIFFLVPHAEVALSTEKPNLRPLESSKSMDNLPHLPHGNLQKTELNGNSPKPLQGKESHDSKPNLINSANQIRGQVKIDSDIASVSKMVSEQRSKYAYVTLISGIDSTFRYRGFLYNAMIMKKALSIAGSQADFIAMIGYNEDDVTLFEDDMQLLRSMDIIIHVLPRWVHEDHDLSFAEMALLKITPWSFTHYDKVQFFDGDVMPTRNMDCLFKLKYNSFTAGAVSPLNSGWYLAIPNIEAYEYMRAKAILRLSKDWDKINGWGEPMPQGLTVRGGQPASKQWDFNGSDMDQGLLLHYHVINHGLALLIDTYTGLTSVFDPPRGLSGGKSSIHTVKNDVAIACCKDISTNPTSMFAHFTGRGKPWMLNRDNEKNKAEFDKRLKNKDISQWFTLLDSLKLPGVNSSTIADLHLGSPLGFWNHNFPKGGFNLQDKHVKLITQKGKI